MRDRKRRKILSVLILAFLFAAPATAGELQDETRITLSIISPQQYETIRSDAVPPCATVIGRVETSHGLRDVVVKSSVAEVSCGNATEFVCSVPVAEGKETITVTAIDTMGNRPKAVLNVYVNVDIPPPPFIQVTGTVTDADGRPVPGSQVRFESVLPVSTSPWILKATTGADGSYLIEHAFGYGQKVSVDMKGYLPLSRKADFSNTTNRLDLVLEQIPEEQAAPGFSAPACVLALSCGLFAVRSRKR